MNRIDTDELGWADTVMVFKAVCKNVNYQCNNCPNCAHFEMRRHAPVDI